MSRRYDPRRAKPHWSYTRAQLCETFEVGLAAISAWKRKGLEPVDDRRPYLFAGAAVRDFLTRHNKPYQPTGPGEFYCVACKAIVTPADGVVYFFPRSETHGNLTGTCPHYGRSVWQGVRKDDISHKADPLEVRYEDGSATFTESGEPPRSEHSEGEQP